MILYQRQGVHDRRNKEPGQQNDVHQVFHVPIKHVEAGNQQAETKAEGELAEQQELNRAFQGLATSIEQEKLRVQGQLGNKQEDNIALNESWKVLQASLKQRSVENKALAVQVERMEGRMTAINQSGNKSAEEKEKLLDDLRRQAAILNQELEAGLY